LRRQAQELRKHSFSNLHRLLGLDYLGLCHSQLRASPRRIGAWPKLVPDLGAHYIVQYLCTLYAGLCGHDGLLGGQDCEKCIGRQSGDLQLGYIQLRPCQVLR
jgi:hypothetical protein